MDMWSDPNAMLRSALERLSRNVRISGQRGSFILMFQVEQGFHHFKMDWQGRFRNLLVDFYAKPGYAVDLSAAPAKKVNCVLKRMRRSEL